MRRGFGKVRVDFKNSWAGLGAFQVEQVEGSTGFWCGVDGSFRASGLPAGLQCAGAIGSRPCLNCRGFPCRRCTGRRRWCRQVGSWSSATACRGAAGSGRSCVLVDELIPDAVACQDVDLGLHLPVVAACLADPCVDVGDGDHEVNLAKGPLCLSDSVLTPIIIRRLVLSNQPTRDRTCSRNKRWRSRTCTSDTFPVDIQPKAATCSSGQWSGLLSPRLPAYVGRPLLRLCLNEGPEHPPGLLEVQVGQFYSISDQELATVVLR